MSKQPQTRDSLRIHFSNVDFSSHSGPNTFASRLANSLVQKGHQIMDAHNEYDIFLIFIEPATTPHPNSKIIHRLDGIWFKPTEFKTHNTNIKWAFDNSHHIIWQSEFDKKMTEKHWGNRRGSIIHNGIRLESADLTDPQLSNLREKYSRIFVCASNWHRQKRLKENILLFNKVRDPNKDCLLVLGKSPDHVVKDPHIYYCGELSQEIYMQIYRMADWMIHLAWLDHCPNVVVEALSQGCPVICTDSGGTSEIVGKNGIVIPETYPYNFELTDYDSPYKLDIPVIQLNRRLVFADYLDIDSVTSRYIHVFRDTLTL